MAYSENGSLGVCFPCTELWLVLAMLQIVDGKTMYRTTMEKGNESKKQSCHEWHAVEEDTSLKVHKMAANFLFNVIGVLSLYMGRDKHAKFLRHLGAYEVREREPETQRQEREIERETKVLHQLLIISTLSS